MIELLVVILIVAVLVAIAAPSFLGQTQKAHDSASKQYLVVAYRAATAWAVDHNGDPAFASYAQGDYATPAGVAAAIHASEPELQGFDATPHHCPSVADLDPTHIYVDVASGGDLVLCNDPNHTVWTLQVINHALQPLTSGPPIAEGVFTPESSSPPLITGTTQVGQTLTASTGVWAYGPTSFSYQWQNSANGSTWSNATGAGATTSSYTVASSDLNLYLRVSVTAANTGGSGSASSAATSAVLPDVPVNTSPPVISGTVQVGQTLTTTNGSWTNNPTSFSYQWQNSANGSSWSNVASAGTSQSYTVDSGDLNDFLRVVVTASNAGGSGSASSNSSASAATPANPVNTSPPVVSGTVKVSQILTASTGTWTNSPTSFSYQWQHSTDGSTWVNASGSGATTSSYTVASSDLGDFMRVVVTAQNAGGSGSASSAATSAVASNNPANTVQPTISGTAQVGQTLATSNGTWTNSPTSFSYQWQNSANGSTWSNATGAGATTSSYTVASSDLNLYLRVSVTAANTDGSGSASSAATSAVLPDVPVATAQPTISGTAQVGNTLTASQGTWTNSPSSYSYQWQNSANGSAWSNASGSGPTTSSYVVDSTDLNLFLRVVVTASNSGGSGSASSNATSAVLPATPTNTAAPVLSDASNALSHVQVGDTLSVTTGSWSNSPTAYSYQWQRSTNGSSWSNVPSGGTSSNYTVTAGDQGYYLIAVVTATNSGGSGAVFSNATTAQALTASPVNTALPTITGTPSSGQTLTTSNGTWTNSPTSYSYQWLRCSDNTSTASCAAIAAGTSQAYTVTTTDAGAYLRATITAANSGGSASATSSATTVVLISETPITLTTSGGLITDATRAAATSGDGRASDSSFGSWEATTNLITNGGFETSLWPNLVGGDNASLNTTSVKFGAKSMRLAPTGAVAGRYVDISGLTPGATYTLSGWIYVQSYTSGIVNLDVSSAVIDTNNITRTATNGGFTRLSETFVLPASSNGTVSVRFFGDGSPTFVAYLDGAQLEAKPFATPYVETNGAAASRTAARVQAPASSLNATQGWAAFKVRTDTSDSSIQQALLGWSAAGWMAMGYNAGPAASDYGAFVQQADGGIHTGAPLAVGSTDTLVFRWTATTLAVSVNGAPFTVAARSSIPALSATSFDIGSYNGGTQWFDGDVGWFVAGTGTLSDDNAATLNGYSDPPNLGLIPGNATLRWTADTATAYTR